VCDVLNVREAASFFLVNRPHNTKDATVALATAYFKTFKPSPVVNAVTEAKLKKVLKDVANFYVVTVEPVHDPKDENSFLAPLLGSDRSAVRRVFALPADHPGLLRIECTSSMYYQSGVISVEMCMVLTHLKLFNVDVLVASITTRRRCGRPRTATTWSDTTGATSKRGAAWYLLDLKNNKPGHYYGWRVVIKKDGRNVMGVVGTPQAKGRGEWQWQIDFPVVGTSAAVPVDLSAAQLAQALHQASLCGFLGPAK